LQHQVEVLLLVLGHITVLRRYGLLLQTEVCLSVTIVSLAKNG